MESIFRVSRGIVTCYCHESTALRDDAWAMMLTAKKNVIVLSTRKRVRVYNSLLRLFDFRLSCADRMIKSLFASTRTMYRLSPSRQAEAGRWMMGGTSQLTEVSTMKAPRLLPTIEVVWTRLGRGGEANKAGKGRSGSYSDEVSRKCPCVDAIIITRPA